MELSDLHICSFINGLHWLHPSAEQLVVNRALYSWIAHWSHDEHAPMTQVLFATYCRQHQLTELANDEWIEDMLGAVDNALDKLQKRVCNM